MISAESSLDFRRGSCTTRQNGANLTCYHAAARVSSAGRMTSAMIRSAWLTTSSDGTTTNCSREDTYMSLAASNSKISGVVIWE